MPLRLLGCVMAFLLAMPLMAADSLRIAVDANNPPFMYADGQGMPQGIYPDMLRAISRQSGINIQIIPMPWKRALAYMERGSNGVAGIYRNDERAAKYLFSKPLGQEVLVVYARKNNLYARYSDLRSLYGKRIGVMAGWYYSDGFSAAVRNRLLHVEEAQSDSQNIDKLLLGRVDYILGIRHDQLLSKHAQLRELGVLAVNPIYIALPYTRYHQELLDKLNQAIDSQHNSPRRP